MNYNRYHNNRRSRLSHQRIHRFNEHRHGLRRRSRFNEQRGEEFWGYASDYHRYLRDQLLKQIKRKKARDIYPYYWFWFADLNDMYNLDDVAMIWDGIVNLDLGHPDLETAARKFGFDPWDFEYASDVYGFEFDSPRY